MATWEFVVQKLNGDFDFLGEGENPRYWQMNSFQPNELF